MKLEYLETFTDNHFGNNEIGLKLDRSRAITSKNNFINNTIQAEYIRYYMLGFGGPLSRNIFWNNYWDDWKLHIPRPILGEWYYTLITIFISIGPFPSIRFDWNPAQEPYDIEV